MFSPLVIRVVVHARLLCSSTFRNRGFVASSKSVGSKARLPPKPREIVARVGSRMPRGFWPSWTSSQTFIFVNFKRLRWKSLIGKFRM